MNEILSDDRQDMAASAICHAADQASRVIMGEATLPSVMYRPALSIDGNKWCALYGENLQDGCAGFGDSPYLAMQDFNRNWYAKLPQATP